MLAVMKLIKKDNKKNMISDKEEKTVIKFLTT